MNNNNPSLFQTTFIGEYVEITTNHTYSFSEETADGYNTGTAISTIRGYLLEFDDEYYYLGDNPNAIFKVIRKAPGMIIEIIDENRTFEKILDDMPIPNNESENN